MYSQYQSYHQNASGGGATTSVSGQQWNGTSWVPVVKPGTTPTYAATNSSYASVAQPSASTSQNANLVTTYTRYYYQWHQRAEEQRKAAESLQGQAKQQAFQQAQWADYYADQSSRAAYHYSGTQTQPTAPRLPPAPPPQQQAVAVPKQTTPSSRWDSAPPAAGTSKAAPSTEAPGGMKEYVHKCLAQCSTDEERQQVRKEVEKVIAKAIQDGTMHTMDWNNVELISLGNNKSQARPNKRSRGENYYNGPTSGSPKRSNSDYGSTLPENDSYYGKSASSKKGRQPNNKHGQRSNRHGNNYYGRTSSQDSYEEKLPENDSYYGSTGNGSHVASNSLREEDFVGFERSPRTKKKKLSNSKSDGFERSSAALAKRANRFSGRGGVSSAASVPASTGTNVQRYMGLAVIGGNKKLDETDYERMTVKGTCQTLEKEYLRLTAPPRAELVRPQPVLEQHLRNLKQEWGQAKKRDYSWFCSQLKAVRQDLTVQRINNDFTVEAYETHARIALEEGDLNEYNQCQTQLKELYDSLHDCKEALKNRNEFIAYRIIYYVFLTGNKMYEGGSSDLFRIMLSLSPSQREDDSIRHALKVRVAVAENDYHSFFHLQDTCPNLGAYLMDFMVPKVRHSALQRICKAYRPSLSVLFVLQELGFDTEDSSQVDEGTQWLSSCGCVLTKDGKTLLCKDSVVRESDLSTRTSLI